VHWAEITLGPDAQCGARPTPAASAWTTRTARARPAATQGTAHGLGRAARTARGARRERACGARRTVRARARPMAAHGVAALLGKPAMTRCRRTGDSGDDGSPARRDSDGQWAGAAAASARLWIAAVGRRAACARRSGRWHEGRGGGRRAGGHGDAAIGRAWSAGRGRDARRAVPTALKAVLSAWHVAAMLQRRAATRARPGARRVTSGVHLSAWSACQRFPN
jgi:hypothetical protein